ncbi:MAG: hypothetical protein HY613_06130 [Candidatus Rokubacteria bacterium]|nr:hypothetical protein [Candidatus Rokubacteria bacterium]
MEGQRRKRRDRRRDRVQGQAFMDAAREHFVRYVALEKWREIGDMRETLGFDWERAVQEAGTFLQRGRYASLWVQTWREHVLPQALDADPGKLFAAIEEAIAAALRAEEDERKIRGDRPLDEDSEYKTFLDTALEKLLRQTGAELGPN